MTLANYKTVLMYDNRQKDPYTLAVYKFKSHFFGKTFYVRHDDLMRWRKHSVQYVKYCKSDGHYHKERIGVDRLVHSENLIGIE